MRRGNAGFTLIELLVVIAIIAGLAVLVVLGWPAFKDNTQRSAALNNMRAIGVAFRLYAGDNDNRLPRRSVGADDKWPKLLAEYLDDVKVYAAIGDTNNYIFKHLDPLSNSRNNTSYIMNGFNDAGAFSDPTVEIRLTQIEKPSQVILLGTPISGSAHFYMDMLEGEHGNHIDVLNLELYDGGSNYLFADGSAKFLRKTQYDHRLWLVNKDFPVP